MAYQGERLPSATTAEMACDRVVVSQQLCAYLPTTLAVCRMPLLPLLGTPSSLFRA